VRPTNGDRRAIVDDVLHRLLEIVAFVAGSHRVPSDLGPHTPITTGGIELDSTAMLELILSCEAEFGITFHPRTDLTEDSLRTVGTLADSVRRALAKRA
jgi:acyl carrier protein